MSKFCFFEQHPSTEQSGGVDLPQQMPQVSHEAGAQCMCRFLGAKFGVELMYVGSTLQFLRPFLAALVKMFRHMI